MFTPSIGKRLRIALPHVGSVVPKKAMCSKPNRCWRMVT